MLNLDSPPNYEVGYPSLVWAMTGKDYPVGAGSGSPPGPMSYRQRFSYGNAKDYLFNALTDPELSERRRYLGLFFQTIGHVVHHIQDMAQPQHVRNDAHLPIDNDFHEAYTKGHVNIEAMAAIIDGGHHNGREFARSPYSGERVVFPRAVDYGDYEADTDDRGTDRIGMAEYASTNFTASDVSFMGNQHGYFSHPEYPLPQPMEVESMDLSNPEAAATCALPRLTYDGSRGIRGILRWIPSRVLDPYLDPSDPASDTVNPHAAAFSIWNREISSFRKALEDQYTTEEFTVNECAFWARYRYLFPRAVAFTAGMIDHFLRGNLELSVPDDGIYAIVDRYPLDTASTAALSESGKTGVNGEVYGFRKLRVNVRNVTPTIALPDRAPFNVSSDGRPRPVSVAQQMFDGELYAIVKYSLNRCFSGDGSGEFGIDSLAGASLGQLGQDLTALSTLSGCSSSDYFSHGDNAEYADVDVHVRRRDSEQISVSRPLVIGEAANAVLAEIPREESVTLAFDFSDDPIPLNATDVRLQVVYRGSLGPANESLPVGALTMVDDDAVVVQTIDISEPGDIVVTNLTDHFVNLPTNVWAQVSSSESQGDDSPHTLRLDPDHLLPGSYQMVFRGEGGINRPVPVVLVTGEVDSDHELRLSDTGLKLGEDGNPVSGEIGIEFFPQDIPADEITLELDDGAIIESEDGGYLHVIDTRGIPDGARSITVSYLEGGEYRRFRQSFVVANDPANSIPGFELTTEVVHPVTDGSLDPLSLEFIVDDDSDIPLSGVSIASGIRGLIDPSKILRVEKIEGNRFRLVFLGGDEYRAVTGSTLLFNLYSHIPVRLTVSDGVFESSRELVYRRVNTALPDQGYFHPHIVEEYLSAPVEIPFVQGGESSQVQWGDRIFPIMSLPNYSVGHDNLSLAAGEGFQTRESVNGRLCEEWNGAGGSYDNLSEGDLLKKLIDFTPMFSGMPPDPGPECEFFHVFDDIDLAFLASDSMGQHEPLARIDDLGAGEFARFSVLADPEARFALRGGALGFPYSCGIIAPDVHQWGEDRRAYEQSGSARKIGNVYSATRFMENLVCETLVSSVGLPSLVDDGELTRQMETMLGYIQLQQVGLSGIHPAY